MGKAAPSPTTTTAPLLLPPPPSCAHGQAPGLRPPPHPVGRGGGAAAAATPAAAPAPPPPPPPAVRPQPRRNPSTGGGRQACAARGRGRALGMHRKLTIHMTMTGILQINAFCHTVRPGWSLVPCRPQMGQEKFVVYTASLSIWKGAHAGPSLKRFPITTGRTTSCLRKREISS